MTFTVRNAAGSDIAGDEVFDQSLRDRCDEAGGTIVDDSTGDVVYPLG